MNCPLCLKKRNIFNSYDKAPSYDKREYDMSYPYDDYGFDDYGFDDFDDYGFGDDFDEGGFDDFDDLGMGGLEGYEYGGSYNEYTEYG
ncbi:16728_t:CDS:1, partial [Dentiscutata heterogama]